LVAEKNPDYFVPSSPKVDGVVMHIIPEYTTAVAGLESGALDIVYDLPPELIDQIKDSKVARIEEVPCGSWEGIILNDAFKPFADPRVREAFIKIVDRQAFTDIAMFGHGTPTVTPIPPTHPFFRADLLKRPDIEGAKKLLAEAGFSNGVPIGMIIATGSPWEERLGTAFRAAAKRVGLTVSLRDAGRRVRHRNGRQDRVPRRWLLRSAHAGYHAVRLATAPGPGTTRCGTTTIPNWTRSSTPRAPPATRPCRRSCTAGSARSSPRMDRAVLSSCGTSHAA
jgi:hypothetical protein